VLDRRARPGGPSRSRARAAGATRAPSPAMGASRIIVIDGVESGSRSPRTSAPTRSSTCASARRRRRGSSACWS
jgi:hypothetical protein